MFFKGLILFLIGVILIFMGLPQFIQKFILDIVLPDKPDKSSKHIENNNEKVRSRHIPQSVKDKVWNRDGGKCVECGSNEDLEFDHIIPHSKGGANTYRNIQLLCEPCNRAKSAKIG